VKCHHHPRANAVAECSVCGIGLCTRCSIEDRGAIFCENCYTSGDSDGEAKRTEREAEILEDEDYIDLELMDLLDAEDDEGLF